MSKFCIELKDADLASIIDQVCIAWCNANNQKYIESTVDWADRLRMQIKIKHGKGWSLDGVGVSRFNPHGKCRIQYKATNQPRAGVVLPIEWRPENFSKIACLADAVISSFFANDLSLKDAFAVALDRTSDPVSSEAG